MRGKTKLILLAALAAAAVAVAYSATGGSAAPGSSAAPASHGKRAWVKGSCGSCHTLAAAHAKGKLGPSLDGSRLTLAQIIAIVTKGKRAMPSFRGKLTKIDIQHLAEYIVKYRTKTAPKPPPTPPPKTEATTGPAVWAKAACGSCHTLAAAGASGTSGPNLDEVKPTLEQIIDTVTNAGEYGGKMPGFEKTLTAAEIRLVAEYVVTVRKP